MLCKTCKRFLTNVLESEIDRSGGIGLHSKSGCVQRHRGGDADGQKKPSTWVSPKLPGTLRERKHLNPGCFFCQVLWNNGTMLDSLERSNEYLNRSLQRSTGSRNSVSVSLTPFSPPVFTVFACVKGLQSLLDTELKAFPSSAQETRDVYQSIGVSPEARGECTSSTTELWRYWYRRCTQSHETCRAIQRALPQFTPARLIEILAPEGGSQANLKWRVVQQSNIGHVPYVTLSHCWGTSRHISLTEKMYDRLQSRTWDFSNLPKTYQDSLVVAQALGFKYIWIDSLCIIQDNEEDWLSQSALMERVYQNSACNIAATWADDSQKGCFNKRDPAISSLATVTARETADGRPIEFQLGDMKVTEREIDEAPLNSRGWVLQERYLSRRQISFGRTQVYWECHELMASEQFPARLPANMYPDHDPHPDLTKPGFQAEVDMEEEDIRQGWSDLVDAYSGMKLTKLSDRAIALSGVAGYARSLNNDEYLAGLWRKSLEQQLCWYANWGYLLPSSGEYRAPSWSWLSVESKVSSDDFYNKVQSRWKKSCVEVIHASIHSRHPSRLHSFVSGELVLRGILLSGSGSRSDDSSWQFRFETDDDKLRTALEDTPFTIAVPLEDYPAIRYTGSGGGPGALQQLRQQTAGDYTPTEASWDSSEMDSISFRPDNDSMPELDLNTHQTCEKLIFFLVYIAESFWDSDDAMKLSVTGLILRELEGSENKGKYMRVGMFESSEVEWMDGLGPSCLTRFARQLHERTPKEVWARGLVALDDPAIAPLVQVVTIV
ncbi:heterokaryon incompatibility protein-domain-containing protein [Rhypophila decipiens]|uniref:Heterokaryon incompatibility protein-domain-containing protein n=1 Tax=Rhypophila decipiens TaxID=261697 RepID=A0AAN7B2D7_9PEZI|nr:heterokaryon incompatibility protein-domain-containing protein [Rhypophila decipiens]